MARLFSSGFELNSLTAGLEWDAATGTGGPSISTATIRSGTYAGRVSSLSSGNNQRFRFQFKAAGSNGPFWFRFYLRVATLPSAENRIFALSSSSTTGTSVDAYLTLDNTGALRLYDDDGVIGSASSALSTNTWYRVEVHFDRTGGSGATQIDARIDGTQFAASTTSTVTTSIFHMFLGGNLNSEVQTTGDWFFDDVAINDNTGSFQTSWPGSGKIIHLKPSATGDSNGFLAQVGGTAGAANNFTRVNEVPPNDATSYNGSALLSAEDLFNCDDSGIGADDNINVVAVGVRMADLVGADATAAFKLEIEKTGSGTKTQSGVLIPNSTTWKTNAAAVPWTYPLVTYQDPDSANWTQTTLDSMQIGYIQTATNVQTIAVSNVWASVDYTPAGVSPSSSASSSASASLSPSSSASLSLSPSSSASRSLSPSSSVSPSSSASASLSPSSSASRSLSPSSSISPSSSVSPSLSPSSSVSPSLSPSSSASASLSPSTSSSPSLSPSSSASASMSPSSSESPSLSPSASNSPSISPSSSISASLSPSSSISPSSSESASLSPSSSVSPSASTSASLSPSSSASPSSSVSASPSNFIRGIEDDISAIKQIDSIVILDSGGSMTGDYLALLSEDSDELVTEDSIVLATEEFGPTPVNFITASAQVDEITIPRSATDNLVIID